MIGWFPYAFAITPYSLSQDEAIQGGFMGLPESNPLCPTAYCDILTIRHAIEVSREYAGKDGVAL